MFNNTRITFDEFDFEGHIRNKKTLFSQISAFASLFTIGFCLAGVHWTVISVMAIFSAVFCACTFYIHFKHKSIEQHYEKCNINLYDIGFTGAFLNHKFEYIKKAVDFDNVKSVTFSSEYKNFFFPCYYINVNTSSEEIRIPVYGHRLAENIYVELNGMFERYSDLKGCNFHLELRTPEVCSAIQSFN